MTWLPMGRPLRWLVLAVLPGVLACACLVSCQKQEEAAPVSKDPAPVDPWTGPPIFQDMTPQSGVNFTFRNDEGKLHYVILESLGGGVALIDYDGDGKLDIFLLGGGYFSK